MFLKVWKDVFEVWKGVFEVQFSSDDFEGVEG